MSETKQNYRAIHWDGTYETWRNVAHRVCHRAGVSATYSENVSSCGGGIVFHDPHDTANVATSLKAGEWILYRPNDCRMFGGDLELAVETARGVVEANRAMGTEPDAEWLELAQTRIVGA